MWKDLSQMELKDLSTYLNHAKEIRNEYEKLLGGTPNNSNKEYYKTFMEWANITLHLKNEMSRRIVESVIDGTELVSSTIGVFPYDLNN